MTEEDSEDVQQNPGETVKREKRHLRQEILALLIKNEVCSISDILEGCELGDKGKHKYAYVWRQMKYLIGRGYVEKKNKLGRKDSNHGQGPYYSIKRDLAIISKIYYDPEFVELKSIPPDSEYPNSTFQASLWIRELIIEKHLATSDDAMKENFNVMLLWSEKFFRLALINNMADKAVAISKTFFNDLISFPKGKETDQLISKNYLQKNALYNVYLACMMGENVDNFINHELSDSIEVVLMEQVPVNRAIKTEIFNHNTSVITMNLLLTIVNKSKKNDCRLPDILIKNLTTYEQIIEKNQKGELPNLQFQQQRDALFNDIKKDLGIGVKK